LNFSAQQIVVMVSHGGGSINLAAVKETFDLLQELKFTAEQIVRLVGLDNGSQNLKFLQDNRMTLLRQHLEPEEIIHRLHQIGGRGQFSSALLMLSLFGKEEASTENIEEKASKRRFFGYED
jgi:hypothetical protein